jgi:hypothetical protein
MIHAFLIAGAVYWCLFNGLTARWLQQGAMRMVRDMAAGDEPRLGLPRAPEPGEQREWRVLRWATGGMVVMSVVLWVSLQGGVR